MNLYQSMLLSIAVGWLGWWLARRTESAPRRCAIVGSIACLVLLLLVAVSARETSGLQRYHWLLGHSLLIVVWLLVPFLIGAVVVRKSDDGRAKTIRRIGLLLVAIPTTFLAVLTGAIPRTAGEVFYEESRNRFIIFHMIFFPLCLAMMFVALGLMFRQPKCAQTVQPTN